jgi:hypothetical protein
VKKSIKGGVGRDRAELQRFLDNRAAAVNAGQR